ncbi:MAG: hypothetical protein FJ206_11170 [Gemmatimonadetes bacterium]|nr:hypothetical protein [Gemmatimonadota bacterium]
MTFAAPWALAGLLLAGIPILLHLLARREPPTVPFPATRYLADAARLHQRRLQLQHLLLLVVRTLLIVAIVLAAAGPSWPTAGVGAHGPTALVVIADNSLSSGVVERGLPALEGLKAAAKEVVNRATSNDRLWLMTADGVVVPGGRDELLTRLDSLAPSSRRLDLGAAVERAREVVERADRPGELVIISDLQRSALVGAKQTLPMVVLRPTGAAVVNAGVAHLDLGSQPWGPDGATVSLTVAGTGQDARALVVSVPDRPAKQLLVRPGGQGAVKLTGLAPGWSEVEATLDPDELRADDRRVVAARTSPAARVAWPADDRFVATAALVLEQNGRIAAGQDVTLGSLGPAGSVVLPPADPARIGALNRALAARGSRWRFGDLDVTPTATDSGSWLGRERVTRRYRLVFQGGAPSDVLVTAGGQPWVVRSGRTVLVGSRFDPDWTALPLAAGFLPFLDALLNRAARGELTNLAAGPGDPVSMPDRVTEVVSGPNRWRVEGGASFAPPRLGIYYLVAERDTIGVLAVNPDPRESDLTRATDTEIAGLWPAARIGDYDQAGDLAFQAGARSDLRGPLLWLAVVLGLGEVALARGRRRSR